MWPAMPMPIVLTSSSTPLARRRRSLSSIPHPELATTVRGIDPAPDVLVLFEEIAVALDPTRPIQVWDGEEIGRAHV